MDWSDWTKKGWKYHLGNSLSGFLLGFGQSVFVTIWFSSLFFNFQGFCDSKESEIFNYCCECDVQSGNYQIQISNATQFWGTWTWTQFLWLHLSSVSFFLQTLKLFATMHVWNNTRRNLALEVVMLKIIMGRLWFFSFSLQRLMHKHKLNSEKKHSFVTLCFKMSRRNRSLERMWRSVNARIM